MSGKVRIWVMVPLLVLAVTAGTTVSMFSAGDAFQPSPQEKKEKIDKLKSKIPPPPPPPPGKLPPGMKRSVAPNPKGMLPVPEGNKKLGIQHTRPALPVQQAGRPVTGPPTKPVSKRSDKPVFEPSNDPPDATAPPAGEIPGKTPEANTSGNKEKPKSEKAKSKRPSDADIEQIIPVSRLNKKWKFTIERNIFSPDPMKPQVGPSKPYVPPPPPPPKEIEKKEEEQVREELVQQIKGSLAYEGYVLKTPQNYALVSANGEFFAVGIGDIVLERFKIVEINKKFIKVEVDSQVIEIQLKGDDDA